MILIILNSLFLGFGVAVDAFSASIVDGLKYSKISARKSNFICLVFGLFQMIMPLFGWLVSRTIMLYIEFFNVLMPLLASSILFFLAIKMIIEGVKISKESDIFVCGYNISSLKKENLSYKTIFAQGVATSLDSLSVGLTIANLSLFNAFISCFIIGIVTYSLCLFGFRTGKKFGKSNSSFANILGGLILIIIAIQLFVQFIYQIIF